MRQKVNQKKIRLVTIIGLVIAAIGWGMNMLWPMTKARAAGEEYGIFRDGLENGWVNWSWNSEVKFDESGVVQSGSRAIKWSAAPWGAVYFHNMGSVDISGYQQLHLTVRPDRENIKLRVLIYGREGQLVEPWHEVGEYGNLQAGKWNDVAIPVGDLGTNLVTGIAIQEGAGMNTGNVYLDRVVLVNAASSNLIFGDTLAQGWENWSWNSQVDLNSAQPVWQGSKSIKLQILAAWGGLYIHSNEGWTVQEGETVTMAVKASEDGQKLQIMAMDENSVPLAQGRDLETAGAPLTKNDWQIYQIPLKLLGAEGKKVKGLVVQDAKGSSQAPVFIDEISVGGANMVVASPEGSTTRITSTPTRNPEGTNPNGGNPVLPTSTPLPSGGGTGSGGYTVGNGKLYKDGQEIKLKGVNWFGFETGSHIAHGLWARNWKEMIGQMKNLGFNAVRLPVCPATLRGTTPEAVDYSKNPDLAGLSSLQVMDKIVEELTNQGMHTLLDHHSPDCQQISDLWYSGSYSEQNWIDDLVMMATRYKDKAYFLGIDLKNEPHGSATWGTGNGGTDWKMAAEKAGRAVLAANPRGVVFVEGVQDNPVCSGYIGHWQGGNMEPINCYPIDTTAIPANKLVYSPHVYGPDVWGQGYFYDSTFPNNMPNIWETHFGFLTGKGQTVIPGEWGGRMGTNGGNAADLTLQQKLTEYMAGKGICSSFYWSWNPNSGDTGGVLEDDWANVWPIKQQVIASYWNKCGN